MFIIMVPHQKCHKAISMFFSNMFTLPMKNFGISPNLDPCPNATIWMKPTEGVGYPDISTVDRQKMGRVDMIMS